MRGYTCIKQNNLTDLHNHVNNKSKSRLMETSHPVKMPCLMGIPHAIQWKFHDLHHGNFYFHGKLSDFIHEILCCHSCAVGICNMGTSGLPDMCTPGPEGRGPKGWGCTYQEDHECSCYKCYVTLSPTFPLWFSVS